MKKFAHFSYWLPPIVIIACLAIDLLSKIWTNQNLIGVLRQPIIPGFLHFHLITNTGGAFGIGTNFNVVVAILATTVLLILVRWFYKRQKSQNPLSMIETFAISLIVGGALGNIIERVIIGHVTDFLEFSFMPSPVFNLADVLIDIGVVIYILNNLNNDETPS
jgi:signal peptidase II